MENQTLFSRRGGGYTSAINTTAMAGRATWPFAKLILRQNDLSFSLLKNHIDLSYKEIKKFGVTKSGYIVIVANDPEKSFGFTWLGQSKIIDILQKAGAEGDSTVSSNLKMAKLSIRAQILFAILFLILIIIVNIFVHHHGASV